MISVVLRYDDYSAKSDAAADSTMIDCLRRFHMPATLGVIPYVCAGDSLNTEGTAFLPLPSEKLGMLREAVESSGMEVALHGYSHQVNHLAEGSEFVGLDFDEQARRISKGRDFLQAELGVGPLTFIPPYNSYDSVTLSALEGLGFQTISSGLDDEMCSRSQLGFLPSTCTLSDLRSAIASARRSGDPRPVVVVTIHPNDIKASDRDATASKKLDSLEGTLEWLSSQPDVDVKSIGQLVEQGENLPQARFQICRLAESGIPSTLPFLRTKRPLFYPSVQVLSRIRRRQDIVTGMFLVALALAVAALGTVFRTLLGGHVHFIVFGTWLAACAAIILTVLCGLVTRCWSYVRLAQIAVLLGVVIAAWP